YCGSCHGYRAEGSPPLHAPRLAGLNAAYLARQYAHFVAGRRGAHAQDRHGRTMAAIAAGLSDEALVNDVVAYIGTL
ncbi:MAG: c-type cytochrome, partial [Pseudomonadales bacterium]|nr:c-type cytochrome [Pseudomonadales bacterium]